MEHWLAGNIPGWTSPVYQSRYLVGSGRLFFDSRRCAGASDTNGMEDVYEYEPLGVGELHGESATFSCTLGWLCRSNLLGTQRKNRRSWMLGKRR